MKTRSELANTECSNCGAMRGADGVCPRCEHPFKTQTFSFEEARELGVCPVCGRRVELAMHPVTVHPFMMDDVVCCSRSHADAVERDLTGNDGMVR